MALYIFVYLLSIFLQTYTYSDTESPTTITNITSPTPADQLYGDQEMHGVVRLKCMDYMVKNRDYFSQFVTEDYMSYINRKRQDNCYGNQLEMQAMSEMYNRPIEVYIYSIGGFVICS